MAIQSFDEVTLRNISNIFADILSHKQITEQFKISGIGESSLGSNKEDRIYHSLHERQKQDNCGNTVLSFVLKVIQPKRYSDEDTYELHRTRLNEKLIYDGIEIDKAGQPKSVAKAKTISEAKERSLKIKQKVHGLNIHHEILPYCEEEWLKENYFHSILEITKSVAERLRQLSGYTNDGADLIDDCFGLGKDNKPMLAFIQLKLESELSEHKGFGHFIKGFFSMYRNPKAHDPKISSESGLLQMTEVLVISTIIHKKLDKTFKTGYK